MTEIWRSIKDYPGYEVSNLGRVRSFNFNRVRIKTLITHKPTGYITVYLYKHNKIKNAKVHRLVAQAFIPNSENKPQVNHIDGDKTNNKADNLEWCTPSENQRHANRTGLRDYEYCKKAVSQYSKTGEFIASYNSTLEAEKVTGVYHSHISRCCKGKSKIACGFVWKYGCENEE